MRMMLSESLREFCGRPQKLECNVCGSLQGSIPQGRHLAKAWGYQPASALGLNAKAGALAYLEAKAALVARWDARAKALVYLEVQLRSTFTAGLMLISLCGVGVERQAVRLGERRDQENSERKRRIQHQPAVRALPGNDLAQVQIARDEQHRYHRHAHGNFIRDHLRA